MVITIGQALLLLLEQYPDDITLQKLYLNGVLDSSDHAKLISYLQNPVLQGMDITTDYTAISDDPTRRYFETHLAKHTLNYQLSKLSLVKIEELYRDFQNLLPKNYLTQFRISLDDVLSGKVHTSKFEYQMKIYNFLKELAACQSVTHPAREMLLQQLSEKLLKEIKNTLNNNYIESQYQRCIKEFNTAIERTLNTDQQKDVASDKEFEELVRYCNSRGQMFNHIFDRFGKDPSYENTGREFSQIIAYLANEGAILTKLLKNLQRIAKNDPKYRLKIKELVTGKFPYLENDTVQNHLLPMLQKIENAPDIPQNIINSIVQDVEQMAENFKKMYILARCGYVSTVLATMDPKALPYNVYNSGYFTGEKRGRKMKDSSQTFTRSQNYGLLKNYMPTTQDDIARVNKAFQFMKPSDQSDFIPGADWVEDSFDKLVHPFSNSISGTMLIQARTMLALILKGKKYTTESCEQYFKLFIANLLFCTGGHSLYEYLAPLNIPDINQAFGFPSALKVEDLFYNENIPAFNQALSEAIAYNRTFLLRKQLLDEIKLMPIQLKPIAEKSPLEITFGNVEPLQDNLHATLAKRKMPVISSTNKLETKNSKRKLSENQDPANSNPITQPPEKGNPLAKNSSLENIPVIIKPPSRKKM